MSFQKKMLAFAAVTALSAATAVPAMALENEFHGMFKFMGYQSNSLTGGNSGTVNLNSDAHSGFFAEQRARLMYIAKANDNLKLVTHFELDTRFGGVTGGYKGIGTGNDSGNLDADQLTLETKNIYLDFNEPNTSTNFKVGMQPWTDAYGSLFLSADMTGVYATKKFDPATVSLGWFRFDDNTLPTGTNTGAGQFTADLIVLDGKFALNKDMTVGASYYNIQNDTGARLGAAATPGVGDFELLHMLGVNADLKFGDVVVKPFAAYQFGELNANDDISAYVLGASGKVKVGPGAVNFAGYYLSGDKNTTGDTDSFQTVTAATTYFNPANMWLLVRPNQATNTSTSVLNNDMTAEGRGTYGVFAGYEGTANKVFYNANLGYMATSEKRAGEKSSLGTEVNAQVGYKIYDNLSTSVAAAYVFLGDAFDDPAGNPDDPYLFNVQVSYLF
ncbi:LamB porin family protein, putative [Citrifermentans bremense]|uniref:LamB porin family protein, putative n=1 Tax=Citrifermentans bremense TaxID=60035 RepID=A0A6S6LVY4_9BACT|nr:porin [Citrifermentans bremense]BCG45813.1 LamB porin family protein, putative [Citrifermentans bremense]